MDSGAWAFSRLAAADVVCPTSLDELDRAVREGRRPYAGGTDLLLRCMQTGGTVPSLAWTPAVAELRTFSVQNGIISVGAAASMKSVSSSQAIVNAAPALSEAAELVGSEQIRSRATVAGNLCNASPAADTVPALVVHGATVVVRGNGASRQVAITDFLVGPGVTALAHGEFVAEVRLRAASHRESSCYRRFTVRNSMDLAFVGCGVRLRLAEDGETVESAVIALGAVGPTVELAREAAQVLTGSAPTPAVLRECGEYAASGCHPIDDVRATASYRRRLTAALVIDTVQSAHRRAQKTKKEGRAWISG